MKKGFTLLELLVVVFIIGILAAIALPQYRLAVGKSQYSTIKTITRNVQDAAQRYYLLYDTYAGINVNVLDIEVPQNIRCGIFTDTLNDNVYCEKKISGKYIRYSVYRSTGVPYGCLAYGDDRNNIRDRICKNDTGDNSGGTSGVGWWYFYQHN